MTQHTTPADVLVALAHLKNKLSPTIGEEVWQSLQSDLRRLLNAKGPPADPAGQEQLAEQMVATVQQRLAASPIALPIFLAELAEAQELRQLLEPQLAELAASLALDGSPNQAAALALASIARDAADPDRQIWGTPEEGMKSRKFRNLFINTHALGEVAAHGTLFGLEVASSVVVHPNPLLVASAALLVWNVWRGMTVKLSELEASAYWGFIKARDPQSNIADEPSIIRLANQERGKRHPLSPDEVRQGLKSLAEWKSVEPVEGKPGQWRIIERYVPD
jgi:hypothetical protein